MVVLFLFTGFGLSAGAFSPVEELIGDSLVSDQVQAGSDWTTVSRPISGDLSSEFGGDGLSGLRNILGLTFLFLALLILPLLLGIYIYTALAYMFLARKIGVKPAWLAWIPIANLYLISKMARMHWWPMLLLLLVPIPGLNILAIIALTIFIFFWHTKIFARVGRPEWWAVTLFLPSIGTIVFYVFLGMAAWGKDPVEQTEATSPLEV